MIEVLDKGYAELQDVMGNDLAIVTAAPPITILQKYYLGQRKPSLFTDSLDIEILLL